MTLELLLRLLGFIRPAIAATPAFIELYQQIAAALDPADQATAKAALADVQADNDEGHARLQSKLAAAANPSTRSALRQSSGQG
jgi:hypothetical protein